MDDILGAEAAMQDLNQYGRGTPTSLDKGKGIAHASPLEADAAPSTDLGGIAGTAAARESRQERRSASQQPQPLEDDEATRQRQIERVLKRAQAAKLARNFRNRIQLAAFKNQRGWQDVKLDMIEPHLEQEAQQRVQHSVPFGKGASPLFAGNEAQMGASPSTMPHRLQQQQQQPRMGDSRQPAYPQQVQPPGYAPASRAPMHNAYPAHLGGGGGMEALLEGGSHGYGFGGRASLGADDFASAASAMSAAPPPAPPHKRARLDHAANSSYNVNSVYAPQPVTQHAGSPYATAEVYAPPHASGSRYGHLYSSAPARYEHGWDSRMPHQMQQQAHQPDGHELYALPQPVQAHHQLYQQAPLPLQQHQPTHRTANPSPRTRAASRRISPQKQPLSSSDPTFSSFVDAANALTGMARAPSDPALDGVNGSQGGGIGSDEGGTRGGSGSGQASLEMSASGSGHSPPSHPPRPSTPERQVVKLPGAPNANGGAGNNSGGGGDGGATAEGAAELMLFLAASPSPVQARKTAPAPTLGDGSMPKGRRLFSGAGDGDSSFGGELDAFGTPDAAENGGGGGSLGGGGSTSASRGATSTPAPFATASPLADPSKAFATSSSTGASTGASAAAAAASSPALSQPFESSSMGSGLPATPGRTRRQRQTSFGGAWESFVNASPSPKRPAAAGAATRRGRASAGGLGGAATGPGGSSAATARVGGGYEADERGDAGLVVKGPTGGIGGGPGNGQAQVTW
ncbi:hypothetical protein JCM8202_002028 [Rhodotorula sphaerocarpa]